MNKKSRWGNWSDYNPIALFIIGFAGLSLPESMQAPSPLVPALKSNWLMMHVNVMMLSYANLMVGSLLGILFLILLDSGRKKLFYKVIPTEQPLKTRH